MSRKPVVSDLRSEYEEELLAARLRRALDCKRRFILIAEPKDYLPVCLWRARSSAAGMMLMRDITARESSQEEFLPAENSHPQERRGYGPCCQSISGRGLI